MSTQSVSLQKRNSSFLFKYIPFKNNYLNVFLLCLLLSFIIFIPFIIWDKGFFFYYGDFNVQQIPFYQHAHQAVRNGDIFWDWGTDLGVNFVGSYSFYLLTSPFFWLTLPFPNEAVPHLMAPLLMLKFACAGTTSFALIKRFTKRQRFAVLGALLYAFCGFNQFNIFFNHFHEVVVVFPLMLVGLEEFVMNKRRGRFAMAVFLCAFVNYFFFIGQVVFTLIYFLLRSLSPEFRVTIKEFLLLLFEAFLGVLLACMILIPAILAIIDNPRTSSLYYGMDMLLYGSTQRYAHIIQSLFFPPDIPSRPNFFPDSNAKWASISLYLPLFTVSGIVTFFKYAKKHWLKRIIILSLIMALIPVLNSSFFAFNSSYYARWYYMPVLLMALATALALENKKYDFAPGIKVCAIAVAAFAVIGVLPKKDSEGTVSWFSLPPFPERLWIYVLIAIISLIMLVLLFKIPRQSQKFFRHAMLYTCIISILSTMTVITLGKLHATSDVYHKIVDQGVRAKGQFELDTTSFFRVDTNQLEDNMPMFWNLPTIRCFHSIVPVSIMDFYDSMDIKRDVASRPEIERYGLRALTSVKYLMDTNQATKTNGSLPGFEPIGIQNGFRVSENQYFIPMGFTYDYYVDETMLEGYDKKHRDLLLLRAMVLSDEDAQRYQQVLRPLPKASEDSFQEQDYFLDCVRRASTAGYSFDYDTHGFTSRINLLRENLVFYSVPYDPGWTALVNGQEVPIVKSNVGFMAVLAPAGDNTIEFQYRTPGLRMGLMLSLAGFGILAVYLLLVHALRKNSAKYLQATPLCHRNMLESDENIRAATAYITTVAENKPRLEDQETIKMDHTDQKT